MSDLISRADAIEALSRSSIYAWSTEQDLVAHSWAIRILQSLPSADAVPQTEHDREWIIGCIKHDGFIKTDRFDKANQIILDALSAEPTEDYSDLPDIPRAYYEKIVGNMAHEINMLKEQLESADAVQGWISLSHDDGGLGTDFPYERDGEWVIVTDGKNISVERIKKDAYDHFFPNGRWFELEDVIAWMPLPKPYKGGDTE